MNQQSKQNGGVLKARIKELEVEIAKLKAKPQQDKEITLDGKTFKVDIKALCVHFNGLAMSGRKAPVTIGARAAHSKFAECLGLSPADPDSVEIARQLILKHGA